MTTFSEHDLKTKFWFPRNDGREIPTNRNSRVAGLYNGSERLWDVVVGIINLNPTSGALTSINLAADSGASQSVTDTETVTYTGGTSIQTVISGTREIIINWSAMIDDLEDVDTKTTPPSMGDVLVYNGTNWIPGSPMLQRNFSSFLKQGNQLIVTGDSIFWAQQLSDGITYDNVTNQITIPADTGKYMIQGHVGIDFTTSTGFAEIRPITVSGTLTNSQRARALPITSTSNESPSNTFVGFVDTALGNAYTFTVNATNVSGTATVQANNTHMTITRID